MPKTINKSVFFLGGTLLVVGAVANIFEFKTSPYIFSAGALIVVILQLLGLIEHKDGDFKFRRLYLIAFIASLLLAFSAYLMFTGSNLWVVAILIYALISLYISFRS